MHPLRSRLLTAAVGLVLLQGSPGCGHCDGAVRTLEIRSVDVCGLDECAAADTIQVGADVSFRIVGDGPADESDALLADSGVSASTFFLLDGADAPVAATVGGDSGGHICRNGVGFSLQPDAPLAPGTYTLVVDLDGLSWPLVGGAETQTHEGRRAWVRTIEVVPAS
ncbi:MAG: Ig-like domain-containing protein [Nannocystaceae bacterium]